MIKNNTFIEGKVNKTFLEKGSVIIQWYFSLEENPSIDKTEVNVVLG